MKIALLLGAGLVLSVLVVLWLVRRSPEGHQDARGFHYGSPEEPAEAPEAKSSGRKSRKSFLFRSTAA